MNVVKSILVAAVLIGGLLIGPLAAQSEPAPEAAPTETPAAESATAAEPSADRRDPFGTTDPMEDAARRQQAMTGAASRAGLPEMMLRGYVRAADDAKPALALLDIEGTGVVLIRAGDELTVRRDNGTLTLKIIEIGRMAARIEIEPLKEKVIVR